MGKIVCMLYLGPNALKLSGDRSGAERGRGSTMFDGITALRRLPSRLESFGQPD